MATAAATGLPDRWTPLKPVPEQIRMIDSDARFRVTAAGRRSGKTERAKRFIVKAALTPPHPHASYAVCAPTRDQAKRIWWDDIKALCPQQWVASVSESNLSVRLVTGATIMVVGLDRPHRLEGIAVDGCVIDEIQKCRPEAWESTIRPCLSTPGRPPGWCWFIGRPSGRGFFYELWRDAKTKDDWDSFHWISAEVIDKDEIEAAKRDMDPLMFQQEFEAAWINMEGLAYYMYSADKHVGRTAYQPDQPLIICFDFNVAPGVAAVLQERTTDDYDEDGAPRRRQVTEAIGEVWIPRNSNTVSVCKKLVKDWGHHKGRVLLYGDATGAARKTSALEGNDWQLIRNHLLDAFPDVRVRVGRANPRERDRVNSVNCRLENAAGELRFRVDPNTCPHIADDFEGTLVKEGSAGEIDKGDDPNMTHLTDAIGYYIHAVHPLGGNRMVIN